MKLLEFQDVRKYFSITQGVLLRKIVGYIKAVDGVTFSINKGETFSLVGESGSGKSTILKLALKLLEPTSGRILFDGIDLNFVGRDELKYIRRRIGVIFQDPLSSLDPRMNVMDIVAEPLKVHGFKNNHEERVLRLLDMVGLRDEDAYKYPHQFSGGQRQRIAIARALALSPDLIVADEPVASLDVLSQVRIINLLKNLKVKLNLTFMLTTHDFNIIRGFSDTICIIYLGKIMEIGPAEKLVKQPIHPYSKALLDSIPVPDPRYMRSRSFKILKGEIPSAINPPSGCRFSSRCPYLKEKCKFIEPTLEKVAGDHYVACHFWEDIIAHNSVQ